MKAKYLCKDCNIEFTAADRVPKCPKCNKDNELGNNIKFIKFEENTEKVQLNIQHSLTWLPKDTPIDDFLMVDPNRE